MPKKLQRDTELVQYYIVNVEEEMSVGKVAAQVAHASMLSVLQACAKIEGTQVLWDFTTNKYILHNDFGADRDGPFGEWLDTSFVKIVLAGTLENLQDLVDYPDAVEIHDAGRTEVAPNTLTVVALPPRKRSDVPKFVRFLPLLK